VVASDPRARSELANFLRATRDRRQPEDAGITHLSRRRVPGLSCGRGANHRSPSWFTNLPTRSVAGDWPFSNRSDDPAASVCQAHHEPICLLPGTTTTTVATSGKLCFDESWLWPRPLWPTNGTEF
jgi:hypothetical protein